MHRKKEKHPERSAPRKVHLWSSLQTKFALTYIAVIAAVLVLLNTYPLLASRELVETSKQTALQSQASLISSALSSLRTMTYDGADGVFQELRLQDNVDLARIRILVTDASGMLYSVGGNGNDGTTGIDGVNAEKSLKEKIYSVGGQMMNSIKKGINIIRNADGTTKKVIRK